MISQADDRIGECIYIISDEIEALCQTSFILPEAVPRCINIADTLKKSLGQFRTVTEEAVMQAQKFAREIADIG